MGSTELHVKLHVTSLKQQMTTGFMKVYTGSIRQGEQENTKAS